MTLYEEMLAAADPSLVPGLSRFFKTGPGQYGEGDRFLGIKVPITRAIVRRRWRSADFDELERCLTSEYHEVRLAALLALVEIFRHAGRRSSRRSAPQDDNADSLSFRAKSRNLQQKCIDFYLSHTEHINNWDLVDLSCYPLLGEWLLGRQDRSLLYDLARGGRTIWEQRIGIVSTMTFVRHGQLDDTFAIADILLHHPHDLLHKAVGWLLREAGKRDKAALEAFLLGTPPLSFRAESLSFQAEAKPESGTRDCGRWHRQAANLSRYLQMPRTMLRYAIEKFPESERQAYLSGNAASHRR